MTSHSPAAVLQHSTDSSALNSGQILVCGASAVHAAFATAVSSALLLSGELDGSGRDSIVACLSYDHARGALQKDILLHPELS